MPKPDDAHAWFKRGLAKAELGHYRETIADFDNGIRLKPDYAKALVGRSFAKKALAGKITEASEPLYLGRHSHDTFQAFNCLQ